MTSIGIDLGTTNSAASKVIGDREEILDLEGDRTTRSAVTFEPGGDEVIVGNSAVEYLETDPDKTITSIKRHMGKDDYSVSIDADYTKTEYQPEEISSLILQKIVEGAKGSIGERPESAVITIPADFPESARSATKQAAEIAGLDPLRLLPEPTAACVAYGLRDRDEDLERVAVYDLGGGTFDISIVDVAHEEDFYDVVATDGRQELGGDDFDEAVVDWVVDQFEEDTGIDLTDDHTAMYRIRSKVKKAKETLSSADSESIRAAHIKPGENLEQELTREKFEELTGGLVEETIEISENILEKQGMTTDDIDTVLLVGGSTKMPQVKEAVEEFFGQEPSQEVNPNEAVAVGAGIYANSLDGGLEDPDDDPDGGLPSPDVGNVVPDDIGIKLASGKIDTIIHENDSLPVRQREVGEYTTVEDGQTRARVKIFEGKGDTIDDDELELKSEFVLENIREAPAGEPDITVELELDEDGILTAHAWDESVVDGEVEDPDDLAEAGSNEASIDIESEDSTSIDFEAVREELPSVR